MFGNEKPSALLIAFFVTLCVAPFICEARKKIDVYVAGFFPVGRGPKQSLGRGVMPALNLAVKHVNDHPTILRNYKLHVVWNDTKCNTAIGTKAFFDMMDKAPRKVMLFGGACTLVTDPIAQAARHWHITQLSYADTHPMFTASKYPNFFRMTPSEKEFNMPRLHLLQKFNWTRVGTLFQNEPRHALAHNHMMSLLNTQNNVEIAESQSFADELKDQLKKLREKDVRIIIGFFDEKWAKRIFCEAYKEGMYGKYYQWIITGMYRKHWWNLKGTANSDMPNFDADGGDDYSEIEDEEFNKNKCMVENLMTALEGCIMLDLLPLATNQGPTVSGKNISQYEQSYNSKRIKEYSRFHGYTYDGVWAMAMAIQEVGHSLHKKNHIHKTNTSVQDFRNFSGAVPQSKDASHFADNYLPPSFSRIFSPSVFKKYRDPSWEVLFRRALSEVKFQGVTGPVQFTKDHIRMGYILLKQFQDGQEVKIGEYDGFENVLQLHKGHAIYWPGGVPPLDRTVRVVEKTRVNIRIYVVLVSLSAVGIVMATSFLVINTHYRNQRYIKMSSPYLNNLIIIGCICTYVSVILLGLDSGLTSEDHFHIICTVRLWVLMVGFTLAFGSMFSKTWRVHSIFTNVQINKKVIKDYQLFIVVFVLVFIDIAIMSTWQVLDPFRRETKRMTPYMRGDMEVIPENEYCMSNHMTIFVGCIYVFKGLLMIFGCFLAWETRYVSIPALNDSKYIGMSVYNVVIMCVIGVPISYILMDQQDAMYLIISIFILFCTTGTICLVFIPKIIELKRNPQGTIDKRIVRATLKPPKRNDSDSDVSDLHEQIKKAESDRLIFSRKLKDKDDQVKLLLEELGDDALDDMVNATKPVVSPHRTTNLRNMDRLGIEQNFGRLSVTETTEATEMTSVCSGMSQDEYVAGCSVSSIPSFSNTNTTSIHHLQNPEHQLARGASQASVKEPLITSPELTPKDVSKSVSFRLDNCDLERITPPIGITTKYIPATLNIVPTPSARPHVPYQSQFAPATRAQGTSPPPYIVPPLSTRDASTQQRYVVEREGAAYGGYGGVYVHDYGGPIMQNEQSVPSQRRGSRPQIVESGRSSRSDTSSLPTPTYPISNSFHSGDPNMQTPECRAAALGWSYPLPPQGIPLIPDSYQSPMPLLTGDKQSHMHRNLYSPLNNEAPREVLSLAPVRKPPDLTIINNTLASSSQKQSNTILSYPTSPPQIDHPIRRDSDALRRTRPYVRNVDVPEPRTQYVDDRMIRRSSHDFDKATKEEERDYTRTISRAHLRRDSFGEVAASRRSPSQDSPAAESSSASYSDQHPVTTADCWSSTPLSRQSPSQESLHNPGGRDEMLSQESLGTMSSRGSVTGSLYSFASARSDALSHKRSIRKQVPTNMVMPSFLNGELGEAAASTDDISHKNGKEPHKEPMALHRTSSEPYYNFEGIDVADGPVGFNQTSTDRSYMGAYEPETRTLGRPRANGRGGSMQQQALIGYTHSLRGTSFSGRRATTTSVAAALARAKNASDNALDHDVSILPIFQKLLCERQNSFERGRQYTMSSCPNITIKCDIVEYL